MAEFQEVMKQVKRLCSMNDTGCTGCPMANDKDICMMLGYRLAGVAPEKFNLDMMAKAERIIMDWAEKNPEPRYPSWSETWRRLFPGARYTPCPESEFGVKMECKGGCKACLNKPIHADIAEKLGIKPIGG